MKLNITINDKTYEVEVEVAPIDNALLPPAYPVGSTQLSGQTPPAPAGAPAPTVAADNDRVCRSPVSGTVVKVLAEAGAHLKMGESILVLEAMKMETNITAPFDATIARVCIASGQQVKTGDVLVEFDTADAP